MQKAPSFSWGPFGLGVVLVGETVSGLLYDALAARMGLSIGVGAGGAGLRERNQPAESHERGMENSDQPHSTQTFMSGDGVMGGWLRVRGTLR